MSSSVPKIALIGRTNVGKSTLFNRLVESNKAIVSDIAGTTRDRKEGECLWRGLVTTIIDTGGLDNEKTDEIEIGVEKQAELAMKDADIILFVVDLQHDPLPQEQEIAKKLNKSKKVVLVVGNKAEKKESRERAKEQAWRLQGLPAPLPISAAVGTGVGDLLDLIYEELEKMKKPPAPLSSIDAIKVAFIGKPNVGKSSILNSILGEERFIASPISHTTREPNDTLIEVDDKKYLLIDTAGMRKSGKVRKTGGLERAGVDRTKRILQHADIAVLVIEPTKKIEVQDRKLAGMLEETKAGVILVVNKWDTVEDKKTNTMNTFKKYIEAQIPYLRWAPMLFTSAKTGQRVKNLFKLFDEVQTARYTEIPPLELDEFWRKAIRKHRPSKGKGPKSPAVLGMTQFALAPPQFDLVIKARRKDVLHPSYLRFLENRMREQFNFAGTPIRIHVKLPRVRARKK